MDKALDNAMDDAAGRTGVAADGSLPHPSVFDAPPQPPAPLSPPPDPPLTRPITHIWQVAASSEAEEKAAEGAKVPKQMEVRRQLDPPPGTLPDPTWDPIWCQSRWRYDGGWTLHHLDTWTVHHLDTWTLHLVPHMVVCMLTWHWSW